MEGSGERFSISFDLRPYFRNLFNGAPFLNNLLNLSPSNTVEEGAINSLESDQHEALSGDNNSEDVVVEMNDQHHPLPDTDEPLFNTLEWLVTIVPYLIVLIVGYVYLYHTSMSIQVHFGTLLIVK